MSGATLKKSLPSYTPEHFSGVAAESWVLGRVSSMSGGQRLSGNTLLEEVCRLWPRHDSHVLANELLRAIVASQRAFGTFELLGNCLSLVNLTIKRIA